MGIVTAMYNASSALQSYGNAMSVVGNNLANVNTTSFKAGTITFQDILAQSVGQTVAQGANQVGNGVTTGAITPSVNKQGSFEPTANATDMAIDGSGYFIVKDYSASTQGSEYFTRAGDFKRDISGKVVANNGMVLQGKVLKDDGTSIGSETDVVLSSALTSSLQTTSKVVLSVNLDATSADLSSVAYSPVDANTFTSTTTVRVYDSLGEGHNVEVQFRKTGAGRWEWHPVVQSTDLSSAQTDGVFDHRHSSDPVTDVSNHSLSPTMDYGTHVRPAPVSPAATPDELAAAVTALTATLDTLTTATNTALASATTSDTLATTAAGDTGANTLAPSVATKATGVLNAVNSAVAAVAAAVAAVTAASPATMTNLTTAMSAAQAAASAASKAASAASQTATLATASSNAAASAAAAAPADADLATAASDAAAAAAAAIAASTDAAAAAKAAAAVVSSTESAWPYTPGIIEFNSSGLLLKEGSTPIKFYWGNGAAPQEVLFDFGNALGGTSLDPVYTDSTNDFGGYIRDSTKAGYLSFTDTPAANGEYGSTGSNGSVQYASGFGTLGVVQDGYGAGFLQSVSVDAAGRISGTFSNGQIKKLYQLELARFANTAALAQKGANLLGETLTSGQPIRGEAQSGGFGTVLSNTLEQSNVDMSEEMIKMISLQRAFQANSRIISTTDSMTEELVNLKR